MLELKEVTYLYKVGTFPGGIEEIRTTGGYAHVSYDRGYYWYPLMALPSVPNIIPWYFLKEDSTLYLMREEPAFYAWI